MTCSGSFAISNITNTTCLEARPFLCSRDRVSQRNVNVRPRLRLSSAVEAVITRHEGSWLAFTLAFAMDVQSHYNATIEDRFHHLIASFISLRDRQDLFHKGEDSWLHKG